MLYLEDYLELIEHLPQELRDRFTDIREKDLQVQNSSEKLKEKEELFFAEAKKLKPEQQQCEYEKLLEEYQKSMAFADEKVEIASNLYEIMQKLIQRLDTELEKFKLELEADHSGITEELERRSLELDSDPHLDNLINNHLNNSTTSLATPATTASIHHDGTTLKISSGIKDRRKSAHRHHPYNNNQVDQNDGLQYHHGRAKLSNHDHNNSHHNQPIRHKASSSPASQLQNHFINGASYSSSINDSSSITGDNKNGITNNELTRGGGHYENNLFSFGNNTSFKNSSSLHPHHKSNLQNISTNLSNNSSPFNYNGNNNNHQHSALSATLAAANTTNINSVSALAMMYAASVQNHKISGNTTLYHRDETKYCLCRQVSYGEMVACDNNECEFEWFHYDCVNITRPPKGKWYCPDCLIKMSGQNHQHQNQSQTTQNKRAD